MTRTKREKVFISYSHKDKKWLERLRVHLEPLERVELLDFWSDEDIEPGDDWFEKIKKAIDETKVAVLLISPNFLASDFIAEHELPPILKAAGRGQLRVLPLYIASSNVGMMQNLNTFQGINDPAKPLASLFEPEELDKDELPDNEELDKALVNASKEIIAALEQPAWKQKKFLLGRLLPTAAVLLVAVFAGLYFLRPIIQENSTRAVVLIPGLDVRSRLPEAGGEVANPRTLLIELPGSDMTVDTMFQRIYVAGGQAGLLERAYRENEDLWKDAVRTYLINSEIVSPDRLDFAVEQVTSLEPTFLDSPKLKTGESVSVKLMEKAGSETRTQMEDKITITESPVTTLVLVFGED